MGISLSVYDLPVRDLLDLAVAADEFGFEGIWLGEHLVLPHGYASEHPTAGLSGHQHHAGPVIDPSTELVDPMAALSAAGAYTTRLKLATGIYILPLRHPLVTARAACTVQEIAGGRFMLGVGAGWLEEEFAALDVPFAERGSRLDESLEVMRAAWSGGPFEHHGTHFDFGPVQVTPRPVTVPIVLGGNSDRALRRAVRLGDTWFSSGTPSFEDALRLRDRIAAVSAEYGRTTPLQTYFRIPQADPQLLRSYAAEGLTDLVVWADQIWPKGDLATKRRTLAEAARSLGL